MPRLAFLSAAALLLASFAPLPAQASSDLATPPELLKPLPPGAADLILGGYPIFRLRGAAGGLAPDQRISAVTDRLTPLLGEPKIYPADIVVYLPPPTSPVNRYPVIYVLGRRVVTVDPATVKAAGGKQTPLQTATVWAARLQQVLPRVNWRPSNAPDIVVPLHPPLTVTSDFSQVGGMTAVVSLRGHVVLKLRGPQNGSMTAAERADLLTARLNRLANQPGAFSPAAVVETDLPPGKAALALANVTLVTMTDADAKTSGFTTAAQLARAWAKNLRVALTPLPPVLPAAPAGAAPSPAALPPTLTTPAASAGVPVPADSAAPATPVPTVPVAPVMPAAPVAPLVPGTPDATPKEAPPPPPAP